MRKLYFFLLFIVTLIACSIPKTRQSVDITTLPENIDFENIDYEHTIKPIMANYCITCHSGNSPTADISLTTYEEVRLQAEKGEMLSRINNEEYPMPQGGLMPKKLRLAIEQWAKEGFKKKSEQVSDSTTSVVTQKQFTPPTIVPVDITEKGFTFFDLMRGHWVGKMNIMGQKYDWFSFDYRPISSSHIHGIYEGGTMGNLLTSFFVTNFQGKRTIMARNGGVLNGIYRISYFVLDKVELSENRQYFRLVDAYGGKGIMWMELEFKGDKLNFNSYTSRFGLTGKPKPHMQFQATKQHLEISDVVAKQFGYPQNKVEKDFADGFPKPSWGGQYSVVTSASYIYNQKNKDESLAQLGEMAGDPYTVKEIPYLASLKVNLKQNKKIKDHNLIIYFSKEALTDKDGNMRMEYGYIKQSLFDGIFAFPQIIPNQESFTFHYLHPGSYYLTVVADVNQDGYISKGDITSKSTFIIVNPESEDIIDMDNIMVEN